MNQPLSMLQTLPPVIERYELKYLVPHSLVEPISDFVLAYCVLDQHSVEHPDHFYPVNSLYFDTRGYQFLKQRLWGSDRRFNMRVRSYGDGLTGPYFAEIKFKSPRSVKKFRAPIAKSDWPNLLTQDSSDSWDGSNMTDTSDKERLSRNLFQRLAWSYAVEPKIFTRYDRRAFVSTVDDYARVTLDRNMRYRPQDPFTAADPYKLQPCADLINYDSAPVYSDDPQYAADVVLELKTSVNAIPFWMLELIRRFQLKQVGFSKYVNSSLVEHQDNGWHYMSSDRAACRLP